MIELKLGCIIIIFTIFIIGLIAHYCMNEELELIVDMLLITLVLIIFSIIGIAYVDTTNNLYITTENYCEKYTDKIPIYSLEDNIGTNGNLFIKGNRDFVLGYGQIESSLYYYTLIGDDKNGYQFMKFNAEEIYLIPNEFNEAYYIEKYCYETVLYRNKENYIFGFIFKPIIIENKEIRHYSIRAEIHIPKNYIKKNYNIDLK